MSVMHESYYPTPRGVGGATSYVYSNGHVPSGTPRTAPTATVNGGPGFTFQSRHDRIDWRKMASVDVDRVMRELDFATLQDVIMNVTFCDITAEVDVRSMDPNFIKLFRLSQLIAEYLLHSQNYLTHSISLTQDKLLQSEEAQVNARTETTKVRDELKKQKEECHKRKKMLQQQQNLIQAGANNYHKCPYCSKAFVHAAYLQSHLHRKHPEYVPPLAESEAKKQRDKMEHEMEELRERLRLTESQMEEEKRTMKEQIASQKESQAREESKRLEELQRQWMEEWKQAQTETQRNEMDTMKEMFMKELKELSGKYSTSQLALEDLQSKYGKKSNLGVLEDEDEIADLKVALKEQKQENDQRNKDLKDKLAATQSSMQDSTRRFKEQTKEIKNDHKEEMRRLKSQVGQTETALRMEREGGDTSGKRYEKQMQQLLKESERQKRTLRDKEKEIKSLKSRPKSPVKPPPSPKAKKPKVIPAPQLISSEEEEGSDDDHIEELKKDLVASLRRNIEKRGIPEGLKGISANSLDNKMKRLKEERQFLAKKYPKFYDIRKKLKDDVDRRMRDKGRGVKTSRMTTKRPKSTSPTQKPTAKNAKLKNQQPSSKHKPSSASTSSTKSLSQAHPSAKERGGSSRLVPPPVAPRSPEVKPKSSSLKTGTKIPSSPARVSFDVNGKDFDDDFDDDDDDDDEDSEEEEEESDFSLDEDSPDTGAKPAPSVPTQSSRSLPATQPAARTTAEGVDDDSDWDSEDISELDEMSYQQQQQQQLKQQQGKQNMPTTAGRPKSPAIAKMAQNIERQLSTRRSDHKPVGGVDLTRTGQSDNLRPDSRDEGRSPSPRIPTLPDASDDDDDDDEDSLAISSLDGSNYSVPRSKNAPVPVAAPRQGGGRPPAPGGRKSESDMSNTYGTSMWGSSKGQGESGTAKNSLVSVTDIDDDDLDLSEL